MGLIHCSTRGQLYCTGADHPSFAMDFLGVLAFFYQLIHLAEITVVVCELDKRRTHPLRMVMYCIIQSGVITQLNKTTHTPEANSMTRCIYSL